MGVRLLYLDIVLKADRPLTAQNLANPACLTRPIMAEEMNHGILTI